jgi:2-oxoisovalerate dehydrogenase E1 component beta subunit
VITYGVGVHHALEAAEQVESEGISVEVLDLRSLAPLDQDGIAATVRKTNKALILHEDSKTGGVGAEVSAYIAESLFEELDGPLVRIGGADSHIPYAPTLESEVIPHVADVVAGIRRLAAY